MEPIKLSPGIQLDLTQRLRTPGMVLLQDYMEPIAMTNSQLARRAGIPVRHIRALIAGSRRVTANDAIRLAAALHTSALYWLALQMRHDLVSEMRLHRQQLPGTK